jgi:acyl carrier protein
MNQKLLEIINSIRVAKGFGILQEINPSDHLRNDLGFDSLI